MKEITLPDSYNYIGAFLTFRCNLNCPYCINKQGEFKQTEEMSRKDWIEGLKRIETREDLPITFCGGEPTVHRDFYSIANNLYAEGKTLDLLTNGKFNAQEFIGNLHSGVFNRKAPYASIRFSYHKDINDSYLIEKIERLQSTGYNIGVWGLNHNDNSAMKRYCKDCSVDFREKEYLDKDHGTYKYPDALNGELKTVKCKPSELLIAPDGKLYRCHSELYAGLNPYGHILDKEITLPVDYSFCDRYGACNPCDIKLKTDRFQIDGHCSVDIKDAYNSSTEF